MAARSALAALVGLVASAVAAPSGSVQPRGGSNGALSARAVTSGPVPDYALTFAPIVYLSSKEQHWPSLTQTHLAHLTAETVVAGTNDTMAPVRGAPSPLTVDNLNDPTITNATYLSLTDERDMQILTQADWLHAEYGKPDAAGKSAAPVTIVVVDKSDILGQAGVMDVFYCAFGQLRLRLTAQSTVRSTDCSSG